jgi:predicted TIM-barrel fold metal-dependent hydrolase
MPVIDRPVISADSHITEPAGTYVDHIDPAFAARAPRLEDCGEEYGEAFVVDGFPRPLSLSTAAAAGKAPSEIRARGGRFADLHRGGWDPEARLADQDRDGVAAEVIYPSIGMILCNHPDLDYKKACFDAYNRWIAGYCAAHPERLIGLGQTAMRTPAEGIADLEAMKALGLRGVMMPGEPGVEDYDSPVYDEFWAAAVELGMVPSFHILTMRSGAPRGPKMNGFLSIVRGCQDVMGMLVLGGVFERNPELKVVCAEADAGWVPHFMYRLDHAYQRHRYWLPPGQELSRLPSEYFADNVYVTFQDDWTAFRFASAMNWRHLLWANDFPHSDSTWPWSQELLARHSAELTDEQRQAILSGNAAGLYGVDVAALAGAGAA